jgi:tetratricopeptide (TPR) repeat protein
MASTGRESEAQSLLEQTRQDLAHAKEPQELEDLAAQLNMLGWIYLRNGRVPDAKQVFSEALDLTLKAFDGQDLAVATAHRNLGSTALAEHEWAEAAAQFESALDVAHAIAPRHPRLKDLLEEYATALDKLHRKSEAKAARRRAASLEQDPVTAATARQTVHVGQLKH